LSPGKIAARGGKQVHQPQRHDLDDLDQQADGRTLN